jgi:CHAD domain-containing protein
MPHFDKWIRGVKASDAVDQVARRALAVRLQAVGYYLDEALHGADEAEGVHQLRIWTRRAGAALRLFRATIADADHRRMRKLLRKIRRRAGAIRDCDVHLQRLESESERPPKRIIKSLQAERRAARRKLQALRRRLRKDDKLQARAERLLSRIEWPKRHSSRAAPPFASWCRQELAPLAARFFELAGGDLRRDETLHALRIAGKRLRYALELTASALKPQAGQRLYDELSDLQDRLGEVCDHLAAVGQLRAWMKKEKKPKRARKLRALLDQEEQRQAAARRKLLRWWTPARRERLKRRWNGA